MEGKTGKIDPRDELEKFRALIRSSRDAIGCLDIDPPVSLDLSEEEQLDHLAEYARVAEANDVWARQLGRKNADELIGRGWDGFMSASAECNREAFRRIIRASYNLPDLKTNEPASAGDSFVRLNTIIGVVETGRVSRICKISRDITEEERIQRRLLEAEDKYRLLADFTYDWIYWEDPRGSLVYVSPSSERITGYTPEELMGDPALIEKMILESDRKKWRAHRENERTLPCEGQLQFRIRSKGGQLRWIEHVCAPITGPEGEFKGRRGSNREITQLKAAQEEALRQRDTITRLNRIVGLEQLTGSIAHELNQPLTGILSNAQAAELLLKSGRGSPEEIGEIIADIINDTKRAGAVIRGLRELYRNETELFAPVDINNLIAETLQLLNSEFVILGISISFRSDEDLPAVEANRVQIQQVLINLISNACQAMTAASGRPCNLSVVTHKDLSGEIRVRVEDSGPGIEPERLDIIFESMESGDFGGTGLGLTISRAIIRSHGGRIWAENLPGGGARLTFSLPPAFPGPSGGT